MSLEDTLLNQKKGVAQLIHTIFGSSGPEVAAILERELGEQIKYDHREVASNELDALWRELPSIVSLIGQGSASDLDALKSSSYAFRLMTLAQCLARLPKNKQRDLASILETFGLGLQEVESYAKDFVK